MGPINYAELDPGIRGAVRHLRLLGFETTDSGDGSKFGQMECAWEMPMVGIRVDPEVLVSETDRLCTELRRLGLPVGESGLEDCVSLEGSYDPANGIAVIIAWGEPLRTIQG